MGGNDPYPKGRTELHDVTGQQNPHDATMERRGGPSFFRLVFVLQNTFLVVLLLSLIWFLSLPGLMGWRTIDMMWRIKDVEDDVVLWLLVFSPVSDLYICLSAMTVNKKFGC